MAKGVRAVEAGPLILCSVLNAYLISGCLLAVTRLVLKIQPECHRYTSFPL